jgi:hypothetical protein
MKRTLTLTYSYSGDSLADDYKKISKEYDIEDFALTDTELEFVEESMYDLIPDPPDGQYVDFEEFDWDNPPAPKGSGENPPESAWCLVDGRRWATDGTMVIAEDQPIRIPALKRWSDTVRLENAASHIFSAAANAKTPHPGYFDISFKPFNTPLHKVLSVDGGMVSTGYVFEVSSDRLVAIIMPIENKDGNLKASVFRFGEVEAQS